MKKQNKKTVKEARSTRDGIIFYSNTNPELEIKTFLDSSGHIMSQLIPTKFVEIFDLFGIEHEKKEGTKFDIRHLIILDVILIVLSIITFWFHKNFGLILASIYFSVFVSFDLFSIAKLSYAMKSKNGKERSTARFHSAEHMVLNAYEKLQRIPTLEEAKKFSRFSKACGSRITLDRIFIFSLITIAMVTLTHHSFLYAIALLSILILAVIASKTGCLCFLQVFITNKPSDREIEVAIEGLRQFEIMEALLNNKKM